jgi:ATP-dependent RNA helicase RhlB
VVIIGSLLQPLSHTENIIMVSFIDRVKAKLFSSEQKTDDNKKTPEKAASPEAKSAEKPAAKGEGDQTQAKASGNEQGQGERKDGDGQKRRRRRRRGPRKEGGTEGSAEGEAQPTQSTGEGSSEGQSQSQGRSQGQGQGQKRPPRRRAPRKEGESGETRGENKGDNQGQKDRSSSSRQGSGRRGPRKEYDQSGELPPEVSVERPEWDLTRFVVAEKEGSTRFHDLELPEEVMQSIHELGFEYCTPIQAGILPQMLAGKDAIGRAQTGTGKTAAFLLNIFTHFARNPKVMEPGKPRALILAPTRELAIQLEAEASVLGKYTGLRSLVVYGGMDYQKQQRTLKERSVDILVATPGRLLDFKRRQDANLDEVEILVIDEADRMLDMGFIPDVRNIVHSTPHKNKRQTLFFSATFNSDVLRLADQWTSEPIKVEIEPDQVAAKNINQIIYMITQNQKLALIYNLITKTDVERILVFANRRSTCRRLYEDLEDRDIPAALLTGDVDQNKRLKTLERFREGSPKVLVATDVAGRGIHVDGVSHVVNYDLPDDAEDYVHRIGRTGRAGASGIAISFASENDGFAIPAIEEYIGGELKCTYPEEEMLETPPKAKYRDRSKDKAARMKNQGGRGGGRSGGGNRSGGRPGGNRGGRR